MIVFPAARDVVMHPLPESDEAGRGLWIVGAPIPVRLVIAAIDVELCVVPAGFVTDGGSIPRLARPRYDSWGRPGLPYVFHDAMFYLTSWKKWLVDALFLIALRQAGVRPLDAMLMFLAARCRPRRPTDKPRFA